MILGGYYLKARRGKQSWIAHAPPCVREIWDWLLSEANHTDTDVCARGQLVRSYQDIQEGLCWYVGYRKMTYSKWDCERALKALTKERMIATAKTTRGILITICNYDTYQTPANYESHSEDHNEATMKPQTRHTINKNEKNDKNEKKEKRRFSPPTIQEVAAYAAEKGYPNFDAQKFVESYAVADWHDSQGNPVRNWKQKFLMVWAKRAEKALEADVGINFDNLTHELSDQEAYEDAIRFERPWTKEETLEARAVIGRGEKWVRTRVPAFEEGPWTYDPSEA